MSIDYKEIKNNEEIRAFIRKGNANLRVLGFTDHSEAHSGLVAERAACLLAEMGYSEEEQNLARIAGFMHDIGCRIWSFVGGFYIKKHGHFHRRPRHDCISNCTSR